MVLFIGFIDRFEWRLLQIFMDQRHMIGNPNCSSINIINNLVQSKLWVSNFKLYCSWLNGSIRWITPWTLSRSCVSICLAIILIYDKHNNVSVSSRCVNLELFSNTCWNVKKNRWWDSILPRQTFLWRQWQPKNEESRRINKSNILTLPQCVRSLLIYSDGSQNLAGRTNYGRARIAIRNLRFNRNDFYSGNECVLLGFIFRIVK